MIAINYEGRAATQEAFCCEVCKRYSTFYRTIWEFNLKYLTDRLSNKHRDRHTHTDRLTDGRAEWRLTDRCLTSRQTDGMIDWRTDRQTDWLTDGQTDWLTDWRIDRQTDWPTHLFLWSITSSKLQGMVHDYYVKRWVTNIVLHIDSSSII